MKKTMIMSLLAIMVIAWACDKGGGSEEVAPAETLKIEEEAPTTFITQKPWDTVHVEMKIPDCIGDSVVIPHAKLGVLLLDSAFTPPKVVKQCYCMMRNNNSTSFEEMNKATGFFINSKEEYKKLVVCSCLDTSQRFVDFDKYSLLITRVVFGRAFRMEQQVIKECKTGVYHFNTLAIDEDLSSTLRIGFEYYFAVIPKISNQTLIQFNHQHIKRK
jgi:hypothetical protein